MHATPSLWVAVDRNGICIFLLRVAFSKCALHQVYELLLIEKELIHMNLNILNKESYNQIIDIKTIDGSRWHGRPVSVMVSYLRFLMNSKNIQTNNHISENILFSHQFNRPPVSSWTVNCFDVYDQIYSINLGNYWTIYR